uniref:Macrophage stimulating 1 n=1 Tax=Cyprinus carpio TaxID=7962 RepID=A0A8C1TIU9_CYPCA
LPLVGDNADVKRNVNCDLYEMKVYVRKCIVGKGEDYRGKVSTTKSGRTCQQWWSKFPHDHRRTPSAANGLELNYCRNPDSDPNGPWCYTTDPDMRYESCDIPQCKTEVCITCNGEDYRGQVDHTVSGKECQRWDQQYPHQHIYQPEKYPDKSLDDNYCRNPDASPVPWCYTSPKRRFRSGYTTNCFRGRGEDYRGKVNETTSGIPCQRWDAQKPHEHPFSPKTYECKGLEQNYCRNPDGSEAPWCFTSLSGMRTALCLQIKRCADDIEAEDCYNEIGKNYRGVVRKTRKGILCQKWSVSTPHKTNKTHPEANLTDNYCRNPDGDRHGPWCYTTDPKTEFDYCAIKQCGEASMSIDTLFNLIQSCLLFYLLITRLSQNLCTFLQLFNIFCAKMSRRLNMVKHAERTKIKNSGRQTWKLPLDRQPSRPVSLTINSPKLCHFMEVKLLCKQCFLLTNIFFVATTCLLRKGNHFCGGSLVNSKWTVHFFRTPFFSVLTPNSPSNNHIWLFSCSPAQFNDRVSQICLPPERYIVPNGTICEIAGWGETKGKGDETVLNVAQMPVLSNKDCNPYFKGRVRENEMCTMPFVAGVGACERDYGGPLACKNSDCWVLEGVIIPMRRCGHASQPNIFIRVSFYVDWIKKVMEMT